MKLYLYFALLITFNSLLIKGAEGSSNSDTQETKVHDKINNNINRCSSIGISIKAEIKIFVESLEELIKKFNLISKKNFEFLIYPESDSEYLKKSSALSQKAVQIFLEKKLLFYDNEEDISKEIEKVTYKFNSIIEKLSSEIIEELELQDILIMMIDYYFVRMFESDKYSIHLHIFFTFYGLLTAFPVHISHLNSAKNFKEVNTFLNIYIEKIDKLYDNVVKKLLLKARMKHKNDKQIPHIIYLSNLKRRYLRMHLTIFSLAINFNEILSKKNKSQFLIMFESYFLLLNKKIY